MFLEVALYGGKTVLCLHQLRFWWMGCIILRIYNGLARLQCRIHRCHGNPMISCFVFFVCITTLVSGGANGVLLKLKFPKKYAYADNFELARAFLRRFNVVVHCGRSLSYSSIGKVGSKDANPAKK